MKIKKKRVEKNTSRTAAWTCTCRAISYLENDPGYKSNDFVAPKILPKFLQLLFKIRVFREIFKNIFIPPGMYEYIVARTKYFDSVMEKAIGNGIEQILIFGAGYDSRGIRFIGNHQNISIYELDSPITQTAKIDQFEKRDIITPSNVIYIPIDFIKESLEEKLLEAGFDKGKKSLFLLEGLVMYLRPESVDSTFRIIDEFSTNDSEIVFDHIYLSVLKRENEQFGEKEIYRTVKSANEEWTFGIEIGSINTFLEEYQFHVVEELGPGELQEKYFANDEDMRINATHCIVHANKC